MYVQAHVPLCGAGGRQGSGSGVAMAGWLGSIPGRRPWDMGTGSSDTFLWPLAIPSMHHNFQ